MRLPDFFKSHHPAHAVNVPRNKMPAQPICQTQGFFQIDLCTLHKPGGATQCFGGHIHAKTIRAQRECGEPVAGSLAAVGAGTS